MGIVVGVVLAGAGLVTLVRTGRVVGWFARLWPRDFGDDLEPLASFTVFVRLVASLLLIAGVVLVFVSA